MIRRKLLTSDDLVERAEMKLHKRMLRNQEVAPHSVYTYTDAYRAHRSILRILGLTALLIVTLLALLPLLPLLQGVFGRP